MNALCAYHMFSPLSKCLSMLQTKTDKIITTHSSTPGGNISLLLCLPTQMCLPLWRICAMCHASKLNRLSRGTKLNNSLAGKQYLELSTCT